MFRRSGLSAFRAEHEIPALGTRQVHAAFVFLLKPPRFSTRSRAMYIRNIGIYAFAIVILALGNGCKKSEQSQSQAVSASKPPAENEPVATVHWLGMKRLATERNAAGFLKKWRLPETDALVAQTLDKLALAPWLLSGTNRPTEITNYSELLGKNRSASLLRPLLNDLVQEEWRLEIRGANGQPGNLALAIRVKPERAGLWETNLALVVESLTAGRRAAARPTAASDGWQIQPADSSSNLWPLFRHVQLTRSPVWTIIGLAAGPNAAFADLSAQVQNDQTPVPNPTTNDWIQTTFDPGGLSKALAWSWNLPQEWPRIRLAINGDGENVLTRGKLNFAKPLAFRIEPWNIPTNLIHEPVQSFTAVQGLKPWLSSLPFWQDLKAGPPPNQLFCWAQSGSPFLGYSAAPLSDASGAMSKLGPAIMQRFNPLLATNRMGKWERAPDSDGVLWNRVPIIFPFIRSIGLTQGHFLFAGLAPLAVTNTAPPFATLQELLAQPNLVYFDREITGPRLEGWMFLSQLFRVIFRRVQLPSEAEAVAWFKAAGPTLGNSLTTITQTSATELSLARTASLGLTAFELHLLADWLESPQFPLKTHTAVAKLPPLPPRRPRANGSPSSEP